ncbi:MAG: hypothetical protein O2992_08430 [Gemmatimonadetes bacterium]|jgi:hypothetical protein|nr:hypothetical protein [Gemmatimonadota bacterium]
MQFGKLSKDQEIGGAMQGAGKLAMTMSLISSGWILRVMATTNAPTPAEADDGLWDDGEEQRLADFASGKKVSRPHDNARRKRMTEEERFNDFIEDKE